MISKLCSCFCRQESSENERLINEAYVEFNNNRYNAVSSSGNALATKGLSNSFQHIKNKATSSTLKRRRTIRNKFCEKRKVDTSSSDAYENYSIKEIPNSTANDQNRKKNLKAGRGKEVQFHKTYQQSRKAVLVVPFEYSQSCTKICKANDCQLVTPYLENYRKSDRYSQVGQNSGGVVECEDSNSDESVACRFASRCTADVNSDFDLLFQPVLNSKKEHKAFVGVDSKESEAISTAACSQVASEIDETGVAKKKDE